MHSIASVPSQPFDADVLHALSDPLGALVLPLSDQVLFPRTVLAAAVDTSSLVRVLTSLAPNSLVVAVLQRTPSETPSRAAVHDVGTLARVHRVAEVATAGGRAVITFLEGIARVRLGAERASTPALRVEAIARADVPAPKDPEHDALVRTLRELYAEVVEASAGGPPELPASLDEIEDPALLTDFVAWAVPDLPIAQRQELLETLDVGTRLSRLVSALVRIREEQRAVSRIRETASAQIDEAQRRFFLEEQIRALQKELGHEGDEPELAALRQRIEQGELPAPAAAEARRELDRLSRIPREAAEHHVARAFLEWIAALPWTCTSGHALDLERAAAVLDEDHENLETVKERILEHLAVMRLAPKARSPILCFVGPPGVGKTSLGRSIARALGRELARISLGGMHDEAEIRGHRRTYVGAMPGQIVRALRQAGTRDPVFVLDEVDKLGKDFRGDPASALLEVLDPEQNVSFVDNYLGVPFDLSSVLFIATANVLDTVPPALADRMEAIELFGYVDEEKIAIARRHLLPRQRTLHGLSESQLELGPGALELLVRGYTHEHGVRGLERQIAALCRKRARQIVSHANGHGLVTTERMGELLGPPPFTFGEDLALRTRTPGVAVALAWTPHGGEVLFVEAIRTPQTRGRLVVTGHVGRVMQESARIALSWARAQASRYGVAESVLASDVHLHIPAGAVPKDGPSAGAVIATALMSLFTGRRVRPYMAITGEVTLSGLLLPVGGIKAKMLAARRSGVREVILPARNRCGALEDVPAHLRQGTSMRFVDELAEVIELALETPSQRPGDARLTN